MRPDLECAQCLLKWLIERVAVLGGEQACYEAVRFVSKPISDEFKPLANIGSLANRTIETAENLIMASAEHFEKLKSKNNQIARRVLPVAKDFINSGKTPKEEFERACSLATASNLAPIGAPSRAFKFQEVENIIKGKSPTKKIFPFLSWIGQWIKYSLSEGSFYRMRSLLPCSMHSRTATS